MVGYYLSTYNGLQAVGMVVFCLLIHCLNTPDSILIMLGLISQMATYLLTGFSNSVLMLFTVRIAGCFGGISNITILSMITKHVTADQYGGMLGAVVSMDVLGVIFVNFVCTLIYIKTLEIYTGIIFFVIAGISFIGLVTFSLLQICRRNISSKPVD